MRNAPEKQGLTLENTVGIGENNGYKHFLLFP